MAIGHMDARTRRKRRVRQKVRGTTARPRLCVFRSLKYTYVQIISDETGMVLGEASTKKFDTTVKSQCSKSLSSVEAAKLLGQKIAEVAKSKNINDVVFDRNGYIYHGRVAAVAEGARESGLNF